MTTTIIKDPSSWQDVEACPCGACLGLLEIRRRCTELAEPLYVHDCRMYGRGFRVADLRKLFIEPATEGPDYQDHLTAAAAVLTRQKHCDVMLSSWPLRPNGQADFAWRREPIA